MQYQKFRIVWTVCQALFSTLDMTSLYHQIPVREEDRPKTAFVTRHRLWQFKSMLFALCNTPVTFQRVMELALRDLQWEIGLIYLDDVIIFSQSFTEHIDRLRQVLSRLRTANFKLQGSKCNLFQTEVT